MIQALKDGIDPPVFPSASGRTSLLFLPQQLIRSSCQRSGAAPLKMQDENVHNLRPRASKVQVVPRRALGYLDLNQQQQPKAGKEANLGGSKPGVLTRRAAASLVAAPAVKPAAKAPKEAAPMDTDDLKAAEVPRRPGLRPRKAKAEPKADPKARSMSQALAERSEAVVRRGRPKKPVQTLPAPPSPLPDIDSSFAADPLYATDYATDIFSYYRRVEPLLRVAPDYMALQTDINDKMRAILIDWLSDVHLKFKLLPESLYLTVNLIDRFLERKQCMRKHLQLVGVGAMHIAAKYEEIWPPQVRDYVYICDYAYDKDQILNMEKVMLNTLRFSLTVPTQYSFLTRFLRAAGHSEDSSVAYYASYLTELSLQEASMMRYPNSMIAAAAVHAACVALGRWPAWSHTLQRHSGYTEDAIQECSAALAGLHRGAANSSLTAVFKKYSSHSKCGVALLQCAPTIPSPPIFN